METNEHTPQPFTNPLPPVTSFAGQVVRLAHHHGADRTIVLASGTDRMSCGAAATGFVGVRAGT